MKVQVADSQYRFAWRTAGATGSFPKVEKKIGLHTHYWVTTITLMLQYLLNRYILLTFDSIKNILLIYPKN